MVTGLIDKNNNFKKIPYYRIGIYSEYLVNKAINEDSNLKMKFDEFKKDYSFFKPYFDFLIFEMGYKIANPFLNENSIGYAKNNQFVVKYISEKGYQSEYKYPKVSDKELGLEYINPEELFDCVIDANGRTYKVNRDLEYHHQEIYELIINQLLIYNDEIYNDFCEKSATYDDCSTFINAYARSRFGFMTCVIYENNSGYILYNDSRINGYRDNLFNRIKELYPNVELLPYSEFYDKDKEYLFDIMNDIYENRIISKGK